MICRSAETVALGRIERHRNFVCHKSVVVDCTHEIVHAGGLYIPADTKGYLSFLIEEKKTRGGGVLECEPDVKRRR